jgi:hypothetical protein
MSEWAALIGTALVKRQSLLQEEKKQENKHAGLTSLPSLLFLPSLLLLTHGKLDGRGTHK